MNINPPGFRQLMSQFASGVTVLTTRQGDLCHGITVSSFCFLSMEPPKILACVHQDSYFLSLLEHSPYFGINILAENGEGLSHHFAARTLNKFSGVPYFLSEHGVPLLAGALTTLECRLDSRFPGGDHVILTGDVLEAETDRFAQPLVYFRREYKRLETERLVEDDLVVSSLLRTIPIL